VVDSKRSANPPSALAAALAGTGADRRNDAVNGEVDDDILLLVLAAAAIVAAVRFEAN